MLTHQPLERLTTGIDALSLEFFMNSKAAVTTLAGPVDGSNLAPESLISLLALPHTSLLRCIEAGDGDPSARHINEISNLPRCASLQAYFTATPSQSTLPLF